MHLQSGGVGVVVVVGGRGGGLADLMKAANAGPELNVSSPDKSAGWKFRGY